ncbi:MAG: homocysteine S-methyltransferase family protein [Nitrospinota bacterium]|nr:homocysteine S-methyltransferase family protein [Nitrospinota bacterium]MDH5756724.1 homocysteine S-methyltransferase family protein [Nitrospinota bacterium]
MNLLEEIKKRIFILDGSMGALLQGRGLPHGHAPDLWNLERPDAIRDVHRQYAEAGADIVLTNTFGATRLRLGDYSAHDRLVQINQAAVALAREGAPNALVAGDVGPLGGIMAPTGEITFDEGVEIFREQIAALVQAGVDLIVVETMFDLMEIKAAVVAANDVRGNTPLVASMTFNVDGVTDTGTDPVTAALTLEGLGVDILGINCSTGPEPMVAVVERIAASTGLPICVQPNAGLPVNRGGVTVFETPMEKVASFAVPFAKAGANIIGGCCGTTPDYIRMARASLQGMAPKSRTMAPSMAITSRMISLVAGDGQPFIKIGEKINPTGRKAFAQSIKEGRMDMVIADARKQFEHGAMALDVNVGVPLVDEAVMMEKALTAVQNVTPLPVVIDSSYVSALEAGLKLFPGRALINSINGEQERLEEVTPLVKKYGASVIALLAGDDIPELASGRLKIAERILRYLEDHGVPKERVIFDCLALVVSAMQDGAAQTLETIREVKRQFGVPTMIGLSNVSFGLPRRGAINSSFLAMAMGAGLDAAIVNPYDEEMNRAAAAASMFCGRDPQCRVYIDMMEEAENKPKEKDTGPKTTLEMISAAVLDGDKSHIEELVNKALAEGSDPMGIFLDTMTPAIRHLGDLFAQRKKFIPHLVAAADTMKRGVAVLDPLLKQSGSTQNKGTIVFATVKGDIHDIGKNICVLMLSNFGYKVVDLGKNVPLEDIFAAAEKEGAHIIALSALMTTTMIQMKLVVDEVRARNLPYKVMVGGAVVTKTFADEIGAGAYGKDVGDVVDVTAGLMETVREENK